MANRTRDGLTKKRVMNDNTDKNDQNNGNDDEDQGETTRNKHKYLVNVFQNNFTLNFGNAEGMSEEKKTMIKDIIEIAEHNLDEEVNGFKRVDRNSLKDCTIKLNATLKEIKSENIIGINRLIHGYLENLDMTETELIEFSVPMWANIIMKPFG